MAIYDMSDSEYDHLMAEALEAAANACDQEQMYREHEEFMVQMSADADLETRAQAARFAYQDIDPNGPRSRDVTPWIKLPEVTQRDWRRVAMALECKCEKVKT